MEISEDNFFYKIGNLKFRKTNFSEEEVERIYRENKGVLEETLAFCIRNKTHYHVKVEDEHKFYVRVDSDATVYIPLSPPVGGKAKPTSQKTLNKSKINEFNEYIPREE